MWRLSNWTELNWCALFCVVASQWSHTVHCDCLVSPKMISVMFNVPCKDCDSHLRWYFLSVCFSADMSLALSHQLWLPRYTLDQSFHQSETSWYSVFQWGLSLSAWCITRRPFGRKRVGCVYSCLNCIKRRLHSFLGTYQFISVGIYTTHWTEKRCVSSWQRKDQKSLSISS